MTVSFRVVGTWAELTADGTVAIPATPQAGDRMYLFARWKDFSITATVANWTELAEFADGSTSAGNGTGSVKVGCWYRDWQSGDPNPTIDFSASPDNASVVVIVMQKAAEDVWTTPLFVTAAMTNWTTSSQIVSASSTVAVPSDSVVMGLIGVRDDTATMTRPTTGIDDSAGAITWNGDYVESPATHHSTTTGFDGAADLGYRLVSIGATAALRMTGTISAAETGAALWVVQGVNTVVVPDQRTLSVTAFESALGMGVAPANITLTSLGFVPLLRNSIISASVPLTISSLAPVVRVGVIPETVSLTVLAFVPSVRSGVTPFPVNLTVASSSPLLALTVIPSMADLTISPFGASLVSAVVPTGQSLNAALFAPLLTLGVIPASLSLSFTGFSSSVLPFDTIWLDPGGDAVQATGYFQTISGAGTATFDSTQQAIGVGSYKFDSGAGAGEVLATVSGVLGPTRRFSTRFRYDSVPDNQAVETEFVSAFSSYSGGGFANAESFPSDDGVYATATPARNAGQGTVFGSFSFAIPVGAVIDSVKVIYERKYDVDTSIGVSRVKWRLDGVEGPNHDNVAQPLTDTVVEVDISSEWGWTWQDFLVNSFEVIVEARRGDTDTEHTQSWDYVKLEITYHTAPVIVRAWDVSNHTLFTISLNPKGTGAVVRFTDGNGASYDGITQLDIDTWPRISFSYVLNATDDLDIKFYVNGVEELAITGAGTGGFSELSELTYGWVTMPGPDHVCWFDQLYIDDGDDLSDTGNKLMTAKLPASVNEDEWDTITGTGAVNERPLSETNLRRHNAPSGVRQTYTLQTAAAGDIDISTETFVGYMGWAWARLQIEGETTFLVVNGVDIDRTSQVDSVAKLLTHAATSSVYPSNAAGIGMLTNEEGVDTYLFECGVIQAYEGPGEDNSLLPFQLLAEDSTTNVSDTMDDDPPASYVLQSEVAEAADVLVTTVLSSSTAEGEVPQQQAIIESQGGGDSGIVTVNPGIELSASVDVSGAGTSVGLRRVDELVA